MDNLLWKIIFALTAFMCIVLVFVGVVIWFASGPSTPFVMKLIVSALCISSGLVFLTMLIICWFYI